MTEPLKNTLPPRIIVQPISIFNLSKNLQARKGYHMFGIGTPELLIIAFIVMMIFGVGKLPEVGSSFGKAIRNFKKASEGKDQVELNPKKDAELT